MLRLGALRSVPPVMVEKRFGLIRGGKRSSFRRADVHVSLLAQQGSVPRRSEVMIFEEDTNLIMTVDRQIRCREHHLIRLLTGVINARRNEPGSLVVNKGSWYAVVLDIEAEPICRPVWVENAYREIARELARCKVRAAALHLLGGMQGRLEAETAVRLFVDFLDYCTGTSLRHLALIVAESQLERVRSVLQTIGP